MFEFESEFERNLYELRQQKLKDIAALGQQTYPNSYAATHTVPELRAAYDSIQAETFDVDIAAGKKIEVSVAGRIMAIRVQGKAGFAQLQQGGQRMQIYVRKDDVGETTFALYKLLDLGDHIGVRGYLFRTRTNELTVHVTELTFLTKAMLALPDKYHGLEDTELRYRQRYVDLFMNTGHAPKTTLEPGAPRPAVGDVGEAAPLSPEPEEAPINVREVFVKRAAILRALRTFFDSRGYLEVETPMLHTIAGGAAARPFKTHHNALDIPLSLRIAPELYLKRLVVGGLDRVYEINRNFRNEGVSTRHNPEFTMLEFYQAYANYHDLMDLTQELVTFVATEVNGTTITNFNGNKIDLSKWTKLSMREAIVKFWPQKFGAAPVSSDFESATALRSVLLRAINESGEPIGDFRMAYDVRAATDLDEPIESENLTESVEPDNYTEPTEADSSTENVVKKAEPVSELRDLCGAFFVTADVLNRGYPIGKAISEVFEYLAEPHLIQPHIIYDFPLAVSPLSKVKPDEPDWVERFEFYIGGFEVGNAFSELNDPVDQHARFEDQLKEKERGDDEAHQMDEDYVRALGYGLPPTGGEGIGIDRLTMILTGAKSIRDVILFPLMRPHAKSQQAAEKAEGDAKS
ncbi:MAG: lysyl-tRNA synthetase [Acidobacteriaceae bacterium]|nr:lysyl-tRNA synthetase [Acidobacteriaceae bacterium]